MIQARPWLGYGLGSWADGYHHFTNDPFLKTFFLYLQFTHQEYLQTLVEWGVPGFLGWVLLVGGGLACGARAWVRSRGDAALRLKFAALLGVMGAVLFYAFFDFPLQVPALQLQALCYLALLWSENARRI